MNIYDQVDSSNRQYFSFHYMSSCVFKKKEINPAHNRNKHIEIKKNVNHIFVLSTYERISQGIFFFSC